MTTLARRATPQQHRVMRIIAGAVKNAADAHPEQVKMTNNFARSVAKRAVGTLTAHWPDALAGDGPSHRANGSSLDLPSRSLADFSEPAKRGPLQSTKRSPLRRLRFKLGIMAGDARRHHQHERAEALADALRELAMIEGAPT